MGSHRRRETPHPAALAVAGYAVACLVAALIGALREVPLWHTGAPGSADSAAAAWSLGGGISLAWTVIVATRWLSNHSDGVRALHRALRPWTEGLSDSAMFVIALASGIGEELLFRGALQPLLGWLPTAALFGLLHQVRGPARWVWAAWAFAMGLAFGLLYETTGHLAGCVVAHAAINFVNLRRLRDVDLDAPIPALGGLLARPRSPPRR
jgi:membrane protease YdiL (CAAX protease family)